MKLSRAILAAKTLTNKKTHSRPENCLKITQNNSLQVRSSQTGKTDIKNPLTFRHLRSTPHCTVHRPWSNQRLFISWLETDSFVSFSSWFIRSRICRFVQSAWLFYGLLVLRICSIKSVDYAWPQKTFATRANFFSSMLFSFSSLVCF